MVCNDIDDEEEDGDLVDESSHLMLGSNNNTMASKTRLPNPMVGRLPNPMAGRLPKPLTGRLPNPMAAKFGKHTPQVCFNNVFFLFHSFSTLLCLFWWLNKINNNLNFLL